MELSEYRIRRMIYSPVRCIDILDNGKAVTICCGKSTTSVEGLPPFTPSPPPNKILILLLK